jgi:hypothetical protein
MLLGVGYSPAKNARWRQSQIVTGTKKSPALRGSNVVAITLFLL